VNEQPVAHWRVAGFDALVLLLPVAALVGLAVVAIGSPAWSLIGAVVAAVAGAAVAVALARIANRRLPAWVEVSGYAVVGLAAVLVAQAADRFLIIPLAFGAALICVGLLLRRREVRETRQSTAR